MMELAVTFYPIFYFLLQNQENADDKNLALLNSCKTSLINPLNARG